MLAAARLLPAGWPSLAAQLPLRRAAHHAAGCQGLQGHSFAALQADAELVAQRRLALQDDRALLQGVRALEIKADPLRLEALRAHDINDAQLRQPRAQDCALPKQAQALLHAPVAYHPTRQLGQVWHALHDLLQHLIAAVRLFQVQGGQPTQAHKHWPDEKLNLFLAGLIVHPLAIPLLLLPVTAILRVRVCIALLQAGAPHAKQRRRASTHCYANIRHGKHSKQVQRPT
jgi:hypothetical protein